MTLPRPDDAFIERWLHPACRLAARYHRFTLEGIEHVPRTGPALIVGSHSAITYDNFLAIDELRRRTGRVVRGLAARPWFWLPVTADWVTRVGAIEARPNAARELLEAGELVAVAPGGTLEAIRPHTRRFELCWERRRGFVRLAIQTGVPIILATCPAADLALTLYDTALTRFGYRRLRFPLMVGRGLGPTPLPRPVKLTYHLHPPIDPGPAGDVSEARVEALHAFVLAKMKAFMARIVEREDLRRAGG